MRRTFLKIYDGYATALLWMAIFAGFCTFLMMWVIDLNVIFRKLFNWPLPAGVEFTQSLLTISIILPFAYAQYRRDHVRTTLVVGHVPEKLARVLYGLSMLIGCVLFAAICYAAYRFALRSYTMNEMVWGAAIRFPIYPAKFAVSLGALLTSIQFLLDTILVWFYPQDDNRTIDPELEDVEGGLHV